MPDETIPVNGQDTGTMYLVPDNTFEAGSTLEVDEISDGFSTEAEVIDDISAIDSNTVKYLVHYASGMKLGDAKYSALSDISRLRALEFRRDIMEENVASMEMIERTGKLPPEKIRLKIRLKDDLIRVSTELGVLDASIHDSRDETSKARVAYASAERLYNRLMKLFLRHACDIKTDDRESVLSRKEWKTYANGNTQSLISIILELASKRSGYLENYLDTLSSSTR